MGAMGAMGADERLFRLVPRGSVDSFENLSLPGAPLRNRTVDLLLTIWRHRGRCRSLAQVSGSYRVVRRLISAGAVAALCCCTFSGSSSQRSLVCKMRLCCRNKSSILRSVLMRIGRRRLQATLAPRCELPAARSFVVVGAVHCPAAACRRRSRPTALLYLYAVRRWV